eukprot:scaffold6944_cov118-Isochrysis_galbana.AAC.4
MTVKQGRKGTAGNKVGIGERRGGELSQGRQGMGSGRERRGKPPCLPQATHARTWDINKSYAHPLHPHPAGPRRHRHDNPHSRSPLPPLPSAPHIAQTLDFSRCRVAINFPPFIFFNALRAPRCMRGRQPIDTLPHDRIAHRPG